MTTNETIEQTCPDCDQTMVENRGYLGGLTCPNGCDIEDEDQDQDEEA